MLLYFSRCLAFMSDTTNVMKSARSGVQKLIKNECSHVFDVGCICYLANLAVKAGMQTLPVDIDQLFVDIFYYFFHSSKRKQQFCDLVSDVHVQLFVSDSAYLEPTALHVAIQSNSTQKVQGCPHPGTNNRNVWKPSGTWNQVDEVRYPPGNSGTIEADAYSYILDHSIPV